LVGECARILSAQKIIAETPSGAFAVYEEARKKRLDQGLTDEEKAAGWIVDEDGVRRLPGRFDEEDLPGGFDDGPTSPHTASAAGTIVAELSPEKHI
jgi:hypothetical protein